MLDAKTRLVTPAFALLAAVALSGCEASRDGEDFPLATPETGVAKFNLATGDLPYPADPFFFSGSTDGTLNLPVISFRGAAMRDALNSLDGWSTSATITTGFSLPLDSTSISGSTVKMVKLWLDPTTKAPATNPAYLPSGATSPVAGLLSYGTDFTADVSPEPEGLGRVLRITPLKPLDFSRGPAVNNSGPDAGKILNVGYLVILTNGLQADNGTAMESDTFYAAIKSAPADCSSFSNATQNAVCRFTKAQLGIAGATGTNPASVILSWSFSTQSIDDTLNVISLTAAAQQTLIVPTGLNTQQANAALQGKADIYVGSTVLPYYLTPAASASDRTSVLTRFWTAAGPPPAPLDQASRHLTMFNPVPAKVADVTVPLVVTIPNATALCPGKPANGWPVAIVQHGITRNRSDALAIADAFADACFIVASIDLPLHGITDPTNPLYCDPTKPQCIGAQERTFDVDLVNNTTSAATPDGVVDTSGTHFINLTSPLTGRDNLRQGEADLITFVKSVQGLTFAPGTPLPPGPVGVDPTRISFVGQSLGAIAGAGFAHFSDDLTTVTLEEPGGVLTQLLIDSQAFGPRITAGLSGSLVPGSYLFNLFLRDFQAVVDSGDPINHIEDAQDEHPIHLIKVLNDAVVPNSATDRLITAGGLTKLTTLGPNAVGAGTGAYVFFSQGAHGSMFDPTASPAATVEMQTQAVLFAASAVQPGGPFVVLTNPAVLDLN